MFGKCSSALGLGGVCSSSATAAVAEHWCALDGEQVSTTHIGATGIVVVSAGLCTLRVLLAAAGRTSSRLSKQQLKVAAAGQRMTEVWQQLAIHWVDWSDWNRIDTSLCLLMTSTTSDEGWAAIGVVLFVF
jgi:hypothetical protein